VTAVVHIAGVHVVIGGRYLRQRCGWCGATLLDYDLARIAVPEGQDPTPGTWTHGGLVLIDGGLSAAVEHEDGAELPDGACAKLDPQVTV
jgi:hypothetical protein